MRAKNEIKSHNFNTIDAEDKNEVEMSIHMKYSGRFLIMISMEKIYTYVEVTYVCVNLF